MMTKYLAIGILVLPALPLGAPASAQSYKPTWESLGKHEAEPESLKDAKLGIYFH